MQPPYVCTMGVLLSAKQVACCGALRQVSDTPCTYESVCELSKEYCQRQSGQRHHKSCPHVSN